MMGSRAPFRKSEFGKPQIALPEGDTVEREMLWGDLAEGLVANRTPSAPLAPVTDANVLEGLSQELPAEANVSTQGLRESTDEILLPLLDRNESRSLRSLGLGLGSLFQLLDLGPERW